MATTPLAQVHSPQEGSEGSGMTRQGIDSPAEMPTPDGTNRLTKLQPEAQAGALSPQASREAAEPTVAANAQPIDLLTYFRQALFDKKQRTVALGLLGCILFLCKIFEVNIYHLVDSWSTDENYSHGFLVPLLSLYFANQAFKRGPIAIKGGIGLGLALVVISLFGRLVEELLPILFMGDLAFIVGIAGICCLIGGTEALRRYGFAIFFLVFMVPLPIALYTKIASPLQLFASQIASVVMNLTGVPVLCEGNMMSLPGGIQMFVAEACSGMRQLTGFLALSAAVAYLSCRPAWYRLAIIASAVPIAITANVTRIILTGYIMYFVDRHYASGTYHTLEGLLMMGFGLGLLSLGRSALDQIALLLSPPPPPPAVA